MELFRCCDRPRTDNDDTYRDTYGTLRCRPCRRRIAARCSRNWRARHRPAHLIDD